MSEWTKRRSNLRKASSLLLIIIVIVWIGWKVLRLEQVGTDPEVDFLFCGGKLETGYDLILFIHGLGGDSKDTWRGQDGILLMDHIVNDTTGENVGVFSAEYPTALLNAKYTRTQVARAFNREFAHKFKHCRRAVIVAHSLGGLIARQMFGLNDFTGTPGNKLTLITLGSPFRGSSLAEAGILNNEQIKGLRVASEGLDFLSDLWMKLVAESGDQLVQYAIIETSSPKVNGKDSFLGLVVNEESASAGVPVENVHPAFNLDHFEIAKVSPGVPEYKRTYDVLREWIRKEIGISRIRGNPKVSDLPALKAGQELIFEPGTRISFDHNRGLSWEGRAVAIGTEEEHIIFEFGGAASGLVIKGEGANDSRFTYCVFSGGGGTPLAKGDPTQKQTQSEWLETIEVNPQSSSARCYGGAVTLIGTDNIDFDFCSFTENQAWQGGAVALLGSTRSDFDFCTFTSNSSAFGGGAIFTQWSIIYAKKCVFNENSTRLESAEKSTAFACGGGIYGGAFSGLNIFESTFRVNVARYAGGAIYLLDTHLKRNQERASQIQFTSFEGNRAQGYPNGGSIVIDDVSDLDCTELLIENEKVDIANIGRSIVNSSYHRVKFATALSGLTLDGQRIPRSVKPEQTAGKTTPLLLIQDALLACTTCYTVMPSRTIDTIVIHHISAINWNDPLFRKLKGREIKRYYDGPPIGENRDVRDYKYDWRLCKAILEIYNYSSHYLIDREGVVLRLVAEKDVAYHAGNSQMPDPDNRQDVNQFSIGIELISSHPKDDPVVADGTEPAYTPEQYASLIALIRDLRSRYRIPLSSIVGHDEIAGERAVALGLRIESERKHDPGPNFDWELVKSQVSKN